MYHIAYPSKYRRVVFIEKVDQVLKEVCLGIADRYEIDFLEIGVDRDHVHFLVQLYLISYKTNRQLGFFENHDELYYNVVGTDVVFSIEKATARVHLPASVPQKQKKGQMFQVIMRII